MLRTPSLRNIKSQCLRQRAQYSPSNGKAGDTMIHAKWIIPVVPETKWFQDHSIVIDKGRIYDILDTKTAITKYSHINNVHTRPDHALIPGLINSHNHSPMNLFRGFADDLALQDWLHNFIFPAEADWMSAHFVQESSQLAIGEMVKSGTTCFTDMYYFGEETAREASRTGMRANIGMTLLDFPTAWAKTDEEYIEKIISYSKEFKDDPNVQITLAPHAPYTVKDSLFTRIAEASQQHNLRVTCHIHETRQEVEDSLRIYGKRPIERLNQLGIVNDKLLAVHCTQMTEEEMELFASRGVSVAHCPESNCKLASGTCLVDMLYKKGVNVCIGTDSVASNNELDMFGEIKMAAFIGKQAAEDPEACAAATVLSMGTINGARAIGLENEIGSLEIGKSADIVALDFKSLFTVPVYNPITQLVYSIGRDRVTDVWIKGEAKVRNSQLLIYDEEMLYHIAKKWGDQIYAKTFVIQNEARRKKNLEAQ